MKRRDYVSRRLITYRPISTRSDSETARLFDEWVAAQPEPTRAQALAHVAAVKQKIQGLGNAGAKALVFLTYAEVLAMEKNSAENKIARWNGVAWSALESGSNAIEEV